MKCISKFKRAHNAQFLSTFKHSRLKPEITTKKQLMFSITKWVDQKKWFWTSTLAILVLWHNRF